MFNRSFRQSSLDQELFWHIYKRFDRVALQPGRGSDWGKWQGYVENLSTPCILSHEWWARGMPYRIKIPRLRNRVTTNPDNLKAQSLGQRELWRESGTSTIVAAVGCSISRSFYCSASGASVAVLVTNAKQTPWPVSIVSYPIVCVPFCRYIFSWVVYLYMLAWGKHYLLPLLVLSL